MWHVADTPTVGPDPILLLLLVNGDCLLDRRCCGAVDVSVISLCAR